MKSALSGLGEGVDSPIETTLCVLPHDARCAPTDLKFLLVGEREWSET